LHFFFIGLPVYKHASPLDALLLLYFLIISLHYLEGDWSRAVMSRVVVVSLVLPLLNGCCRYLGTWPHFNRLCISRQMNLARHSISSTDPLVLYDVRLDPDSQIFTTSTPDGFAVYRTLPLELVRTRGNNELTILLTLSLITFDRG